MVDFMKFLSPERQKEIAEINQFYEKRLIEFRNMTNQNLISSTKYFCSQMQSPSKYTPGVPVYDSTFWHIILPELLRRLEKDENN